MMRVRFSPGEAFSRLPLLVALLLPLSGCSSAPLEDGQEPNQETPEASAGGSQTATPEQEALPAGPDYYKQDYPPGPYGVGVGSTLEDFAFLGWRDPVAADYDLEKLETVRLSEFYNPDGRGETTLIWINASAVWCSVCRAEMRDIKTQGVNASMRPRGLQMIETLFEDNGGGPATLLDLQKWGQVAEHSIDFPLLLDPGFKLGAFFTSDATPLNLLVDARSMRVLDATMGYSSDYWQRVDELLSR